MLFVFALDGKQDLPKAAPVPPRRPAAPEQAN
jgi:hypothetical protein